MIFSLLDRTSLQIIQLILSNEEVKSNNFGVLDSLSPRIRTNRISLEIMKEICASNLEKTESTDGLAILGVIKPMLIYDVLIEY